MGLVDYSSSDNDSDASLDNHARPPAKKPRTSATPHNITTATTTTNHLPPLPSSFHNLYATTVRHFTADLPSLHQGRKRLIPHVDGNWPSHIYVEWHPPPAHHETLVALVRSLQSELQPHLQGGGGDDGGDDDYKARQQLTTFLTSDLGAPLPLHISLSRPFVLRTDQKAAFLDTLARRVASVGAAITPPFELCVADDDDDDGGGDGGGGSGLAWFRSAEASRSFLVLRVRAAVLGAGQRSNPQLAALLSACNKVVAAQGQPRLYARSSRKGSGDGGEEEEEEEDEAGGGGVQPVEDEGDGVDGAFHMSIAWSFAEPTEEIRARTAAVFAHDEVWRGALRDIRILVDNVKVKIGNVVTDIPLTDKRGNGSGGGKTLFGI